jgi:hypothetical protein
MHRWRILHKPRTIRSRCDHAAKKKRSNLNLAFKFAEFARLCAKANARAGHQSALWQAEPTRFAACRASGSEARS